MADRLAAKQAAAPAAYPGFEGEEDECGDGEYISAVRGGAQVGTGAGPRASAMVGGAAGWLLAGQVVGQVALAQALARLSP